MAEVIVKEPIGASADAVWALVGDFGGLERWAQGIQRCEVEGEGVGAVRRLSIAGGLALVERLESYDGDARTFSYSIVGDTPLPFRDYLSTVRISESGDDACTLEWRGRFQPSEGAEDQARSIVQSIYTGSVAALKKKLGV